MGHKVRGVAHRKVVAFGNDNLPRVWKKPFPLWLKFKRIVPLAKYREQRQLSKRARQRALRFPVQVLAFARVAHICMEGPQAVASDAREKRTAARRIQRTSNTKRTPRAPPHNSLRPPH